MYFSANYARHFTSSHIFKGNNKNGESFHAEKYVLHIITERKKRKVFIFIRESNVSILVRVSDLS